MHSKNNNNGAYLFLVLFPGSASSFSTLSYTHTHTLSLSFSQWITLSLSLSFSLSRTISRSLSGICLSQSVPICLTGSLPLSTHSLTLFLSLLSQSISFLVLKPFCKREKLDKAKFKFRKTLPEKSSIKSKSSFQILSRKLTFVFSNSKSTTSKFLIFGFTTSRFSL